MTVLIALGTLGLSLQAFRRWLSFHNHTFDLAMYARMSWGYAHFNWWDPFVSAWFFGVHLSPILLPLGILGALFDVVPVLLTAQAAVVSLSAWPIAMFAAKRFGPWSAPLAALIWVLYPNLGHVVTDEFHPGTLAVLPMAWSVYALDARNPRLLKWSVIAILTCREDLALMCALIGMLAVHTKAPELERLGRQITGYALLYFAVFSLLLLPLFGPKNGSLFLHFGKWGASSLPQVAWHLLTHPGDLWMHLTAPARVLYLPLVLLTVGFIFPLVQSKWLLLAAPTLAINLLSDFPGVTTLGSHYLTPALPFIVMASIDGAHTFGSWCKMRLADSLCQPILLGVVLVCTALAHLLYGGLPWSRDYLPGEFRMDARSVHAEKAISLIPPHVSVQAPDALLSHLAERDRVHRGPPPDMNTEFAILDIAYRQNYPPDGSVLRTIEEPIVRSWLSKPNYVLRLANPDFLILERGADPRDGAYAAAYLRQQGAREQGTPICACLSAVSGSLRDRVLTLRLFARDVCPSDLALRIGHERKPAFVALPFDGLLSPAQLRKGDLMQSRHTLSPAQAAAIRRDGLRVGAIRSSGARPEPRDPDAVLVPLS